LDNIYYIIRTEEIVNKLPQVFYVGTFHGNEVLGANTLTYMAEYFLENPDQISESLMKERLFVMVPLANPSGIDNS